MQINATIIAAQQAAREARATLIQPKPQPAASFLAALDKEVAEPAPARPVATPAAPRAPTRPGSLLDIRI